MGRDRIADHARAGAEIVTGTDVSCLMHLEGLARREKSPLLFMHVAEVPSALSRIDPPPLTRSDPVYAG